MRAVQALWILLANAVALCTPTSLATAATSPPSAEAFSRVAPVRNVVLAPSGKLLAWTEANGAHPRVVMFDLDAGAVKRALMLPEDMKLRDLNWADDETLLIDVSLTHAVDLSRGHTSYEWFRTLAADVAGGEMRVLLLRDAVRSWNTGSELIAPRTSKRKSVVMAAWDFDLTNYTQETGSRIRGGRKDGGVTRDLFLVDTVSGVGRPIAQGTPFTLDWVVDSAGDARVRSEWEPARRLYRVLHRRGQGWDEIYKEEIGAPGRRPPTLLELTADEGGAIVWGSLRGSSDTLWSVPVDGSAPAVLIDGGEYGVNRIIRDPFTWRIVGATSGGPQGGTHWLDSDARNRATALEKAFAGRQVLVTGRSEDRARVIAQVGSHALPTVHYLVDYKKGTADIVAEEHPALADAKLGAVRVMEYKARDGVAIPAYVTLPPAMEPKALPLVVLPHGGPESHDAPEFDWLAQFLATRGYAVLQPQFRGSTGYGEEFRKAGYRQWGRLMQDDVTDGVKALIDEGMVDARRVCIVGGSYGGYAALAGAAFTPELYACAASINGVSDLPLILGYVQSRGEESNAVYYWKEHIGSSQAPEVIARSPARAAANIRAPILLLHGADDTVVPPLQSEVMVSALRQHRKVHRLITLPAEDHWLSRSDSRLQVLQELEIFLAEHLALKAE